MVSGMMLVPGTPPAAGVVPPPRAVRVIEEGITAPEGGIVVFNGLGTTMTLLIVLKPGDAVILTLPAAGTKVIVGRDGTPLHKF